MGKYCAVFKGKSIQMLSYWGPQLVWVLSSIMSLVLIAAVWQSSDASGDIAGYTKNQLITYAIVGIVASAFINFNPFGSIKQDIKGGAFATKFMIKPISIYFSRLALEGSWRLYFFAYSLVAGILACFIYKDYLSFSFNTEFIPVLIITVVLATLLQFTLSMCLGMMAFWYTEVNALNSLKWLALGILGGLAIPISFIPESYQRLVLLLPFRYMYSFPIEIFFNKLTNSEILIGLVVQTIWLVIFIFIYKLILKLGIKKYVSVGQ